MTITEQEFNYIIEIAENENTRETYLFFLLHHFYIYKKAVKWESK